MKILASVLTVLLLPGVQPTSKPDFTGEWTMNAANSNFAGLPGPTSITRSIKHTEPALTIVETQSGGVQDGTVTRKYMTDGTPTTFDAAGFTLGGSAKWDASTLIVISKVDAVGVTYTDKMTLSADGKTLTSVVHLASPQGEIEMTIVFEKK